MTEVYGFGQTFDHRRFIRNIAILADAFGVLAAQTPLSQEILDAYFGGTEQPGARQLTTPANQREPRT